MSRDLHAQKHFDRKRSRTLDRAGISQICGICIFSIFCLTLNYTHGKNSQIVTGLFVLSAAEYF